MKFICPMVVILIVNIRITAKYYEYHHITFIQQLAFPSSLTCICDTLGNSFLQHKVLQN